MAGARDQEAVGAAAEALEGLGHPVLAADAALMAARAGATLQAGHQARSLRGSMGMHPLLGLLPETRWGSGDLRQESAAGA